MLDHKALRIGLTYARAAASLSKDDRRVGAAVLGPRYDLRISAYNGLPMGAQDNVPERSRKPLKLHWTCHAEENTVALAARAGISLDGCTLVVTELFPCAVCARMTSQAGIVRVIAPRMTPGEQNAFWEEQAVIAAEIFREVGVEVQIFEEDQPT
ncbi:deoxycytidylate deaminase [Burkholderia ubonensis]|uniref:deoxycytidylate deaminase n=1 Tax=Burkholderia ubonensis TaxID=101571 RepID=UPI0018DF52F6|nr:deaminase [Burkholderia ubonensis]